MKEAEHLHRCGSLPDYPAGYTWAVRQVEADSMVVVGVVVVEDSTGSLQQPVETALAGYKPGWLHVCGGDGAWLMRWR